MAPLASSPHSSPLMRTRPELAVLREGRVHVGRVLQNLCDNGAGLAPSPWGATGGKELGEGRCLAPSPFTDSPVHRGGHVRTKLSSSKGHSVNAGHWVSPGRGLALAHWHWT